MKKNFVFAFALMLGAATLGVNSLRAEGRAWDVNIPHQFRVQNLTLPSGSYRLIQPVGSDIAILLNKKTGHEIRLLRPASVQVPGKVLFTLIPDKDGYRLKVS